MQVSNYTLTLRRSGVVAPNVGNATSSGFAVLLGFGDIVRSHVFQNVGCMEVSLQTNSSNVAAFISSYPDYLAMFRQGRSHPKCRLPSRHTLSVQSIVGETFCAAVKQPTWQLLKWWERQT